MLKSNQIVIEMPPRYGMSRPVYKFHDGMSLTWDQVTEIYEDEERRIHFIAFDSDKVSTDRMLQEMLEQFQVLVQNTEIVVWKPRDQ